MKNVKKKIGSDHGMATLIFIMIIAIIVMCLIIILPVLDNMKEQERLEQDKGHEHVAEDSAYMEYIAGGSFEAVYDAIEKKFVDVGDIGEVEPYGNAKEHQGLVILVNVDDEGHVVLTWVDPDEYILKKSQEKSQMIKSAIGS